MIRGKGFYLRRPEAGDIAYLAEHMREADRRELRRWSGQDAAHELDFAVRFSDTAYTGCLDDGTILSMFGGARTNLMDEIGVIWELSAREVEANKRLFARASRAGFDAVCRDLSDVHQFYNWVDTDYEAAVRWIQWLGGTMSLEPSVQGRFGGVFQQFWIMNPYYGRE